MGARVPQSSVIISCIALICSLLLITAPLSEAKLQCWVCSDYRDQSAQISTYGRNIVPPCDDDIGSANYGVLVDVADSENYMCTVFHRNDQYGKVVLRGYSSKANLQNTFGVDEPECKTDVRFPQLSQERFYMCACHWSMCNRNGAGRSTAAAMAPIALLALAAALSWCTNSRRL